MSSDPDETTTEALLRIMDEIAGPGQRALEHYDAQLKNAKDAVECDYANRDSKAANELRRRTANEKSSKPSDENQRDNSAGVEEDEPVLYTETQMNILKALNGRALTGDQLKLELDTDRTSLYYSNRKQKTGGLAELKERGEVKNKRGLGFYRPDAPPKQV